MSNCGRWRCAGIEQLSIKSERSGTKIKGIRKILFGKAVGTTITPSQASQSNQTPMESIYENPKIKKLANCCKEGDAKAMLDMAYFFKDRCEKPMRELLDAYELNSVSQNEELVDKYLKEHYGEGVRMAEVYMMWVVRAARSGNEQARTLLVNCPCYRKHSYIPYAVFTGDDDMAIWASDSLWEIGFIDMVRGCTDCRLIPHREKGCFELLYVSYYDPPDDTGFGAEYEYESVYYNEFFRKL